MPRWRQVYNKETGKSEFIPLDESARQYNGHFVHGDVEPFVSPVDGTVISDRKQLREHNERNNVVPTSEFTSDWDAARKERDKYYKGEVDRQEKQRRREQMNEIINHLERKADRGY